MGESRGDAIAAARGTEPSRDGVREACGQLGNEVSLLVSAATDPKGETGCPLFLAVPVQGLVAVVMQSMDHSFSVLSE